MALFSYNGRNVAYRILQSPFTFDLVLLQGSDYNQDFWQPLLNDFAEQPVRDGRILLCDWHDPNVPEDRLPGDLVRMMNSLGITGARVVATDDAVELVAEAQQQHAGLFEKNLFFANGAPKAEELRLAVRGLQN